MDQLHRHELALAATKAKEELAADNLSLKHDPTAGIPEPLTGPLPPAEPPAPAAHLPHHH